MDTLDIAFAEARRYLDSLDTRPVASRGTPADMRAPLPTHFPEQGMPATDVVRAIAAAVEPGLTGNAGGRFFAWVKGGALPAALATDMMCSAWDQNAVLASTSPAGAVLEEVAGRFLLEALRLPAIAATPLSPVARWRMPPRWPPPAMPCWRALAGMWKARACSARRRSACWPTHTAMAASTARCGCSASGTGCIVPLGGGAGERGRVARALDAALAAAAGAPTIVILNAGDLNLGRLR